MDRVQNPFAPGAGNPPPELAGRASLVEDIDVAFGRLAIGRSTQGAILVGLRGVGKTVLLVMLKDLAETKGFKVHLAEAREGTSLPELIVPGLRSILFSLSAIEGAKDLSRRAIRVLKSFVSALKVTVDDIEYGLSVNPETGVADSGDLEVDLPDLFQSIGEAAKSAGKPVVLLIDELQYLSEKEFSSLIMAMHRVSQQGLPLLLVGAGLPQILALAGESKSYSERLFRYPKIGALSKDDAALAISNPIRAQGNEIESEAVNKIINVTEGYPYFIQQWSHDAWNVATGPIIRAEDVDLATDIAIRQLDESFFRVRFDRCTPSEKRYMRALADLGSGHHRSGDIAERLGLKTTSVGPTRGKLIKKGMIYSPQHGDTAFTVPLFDAYMRRVIPTFE